MKNDFFGTREYEGRMLWFELNRYDVLSGKKCIQFTQDEGCRYDFLMTAWTTSAKSVGEIKTVHRDYYKYPNFQIDYLKVKILQDTAREHGRKAYVVGFFTDFTIVWDVTDMDLEPRRYKRFCTATTNNYCKGKKEKEEVWLTIDEAIYKEKKFNN